MAIGLAIVAAVVFRNLGREVEPDAGPPHVVVIILDTVRADAIGAVLEGQSITPYIDGLIAESTVFSQAFTPAPWTVPSHASLFTGRYPHEHGARHGHYRLDSQTDTLAERLEARGYRTAGFTCNPWLNQGSGFSQGFDVYREPFRMADAAPDKGAAAATEMILEWLDQRKAQDPPFLLFVNYLEAHLPYAPPKAILDTLNLTARGSTSQEFSIPEAERHITGEQPVSEDRLEQVKRLYLAEVHYLDQQVRRIVDALRQRGWLDNTLLIITSDHGEHLGEHGLTGHEFSLHQPVLHIPLLIRCPGVMPKGRRVSMPASLVDLLPTVLAVVDEKTGASDLSGVNLLDLVHADPDQDRPVVAEYARPERLIHGYWQSRHPRADLSRYDVSLRSVRDGGFKYIVSGSGEERLFDLKDDPPETHDISADAPDRLASLRSLLHRLLGPVGADASGPGGSPPGGMDAEQRERLRALGYVE